MNVKTIVKVMNFHALIRVDRARRDADQYAKLEQEVVHMMDIIQNNRNFILDKWILNAPAGAPRLRIYIGSDLGFRGAVNASVNSRLARETGENSVVVIGRKLRCPEFALLNIGREEFNDEYRKINDIITQGIRRRKYSAVDLCYDHYYNMSHIEPMEKTVFPVKIERNEAESYTEDFTVEGDDIDTIMEDLLITYLNYEIKIAAVNAFAAENILRQGATSESLKKIDEMQETADWKERKISNQKAAQKVIDTFIKAKRGSRRAAGR